MFELHWLWMTGAGITVLLGLMGLISPVMVARFTGLGLPDALARSEVRATHGGFFLALGVIALASELPTARAAPGLPMRRASSP